MFAPAQTARPHVQAGKLKALAVTSARRAVTLPNLPTAAESGLPGYEALGWFGLLAPAATPKAIVDKVSADANAVLLLPEVKDKLLALGSEPTGNKPGEFAAFIRDDQAKWAKLMKDLGITPE
jgi:tripartite-type tricarboxylate transporter receptor subunit TctC